MKKENKKKILFVMQSLSCGGAEKVLVNIANALVKRDFDVTIICFDSNAVLLHDLDESVHYIYKPRKDFPVLRKLPYIKRFYKERKFYWEHRASAKTLYKHYVGKEKFDVEIGFMRGPAIKIISGSTNKRSKKLAWVHTDFKLCNPKTITSWFNNTDEVKAAYKKMDGIVCVSDKAKESFEEVVGCGDKTVAMYNMIPSESVIEKSAEPLSLNKDKFTIVTVGRLIPDKRHDRFLSATKRLNEEGYDFNVWIVGGGVYEGVLKKYCEDNNLNNVIFTGMQSNPYPYMKNADLFVLTSQREGFALVIPEAMACGLPVLSTKCTGPTEILADGEFGVLVENSTEGIYEGIKNVLDNKEQLQYYRQKSQERYMDFDESKIVEQIIKVFSK